MAITTYAELQTAVANWLDRTDLISRVPEFIALAEADINALFDLRTIESDASLTLSASSRAVALPTGFREAQNLWILLGTQREPLRFVTPELLQTDTTTGQPRLWCIDGSTIAFDRPADQAYSLTLRMLGAVALSDAVTTNLILTNYPGVYLFGALKEAAPYLRDPDAMAMFEGKYADALAKARYKENRTKALVTLSTEPGALTAGRGGFNIYRGY